MWRALLFVCIGSLAVAAEPDAKAVKDELAKLEGVWRIDGDDKASKVRLYIKGTDWAFMEGNNRDDRLSVTIDPTKTPKELDVRYGSSEQKALCLYHLEKDLLQIQFSNKDDNKSPKRPAKIDTKDKQDYLKLQRVGPLPEHGPHKDVAPLMVWGGVIATRKIPKKIPSAGVLPHTRKNGDVSYLNNQEDLNELWKFLAEARNTFGSNAPKINFREVTVVVVINGDEPQFQSEPQIPHLRLRLRELRTPFDEQEPTVFITIAIFPTPSIDELLKANKK